MADEKWLDANVDHGLKQKCAKKSITRHITCILLMIKWIIENANMQKIFTVLSWLWLMSTPAPISPSPAFFSCCSKYKGPPFVSLK